MPQVNVSFAEDRLMQKKQVHIGVAVALEQGLIVPVLHNADTRGILDIARETQRLAEAARKNKLKPEDLSGGTFTISNLGMFRCRELYRCNQSAGIGHPGRWLRSHPRPPLSMGRLLCATA